MTAAVCPICASSVSTQPNPRARIDAPVTWSAWCSSFRKMHTRATKIIGTGMSEETALQSFNAKSLKYAARLEKRAKIQACDMERIKHEAELRTQSNARRAEVKREQRRLERERLGVEMKGIFPDCPTCKKPLKIGKRVKHDTEGRPTQDFYFAAWCPERFAGCKYRPKAEIRGQSPEEALGRWLCATNRREVPSLKGKLTVWDTRTGTCSCGASLYGEQKDCGGFHLTVDDHSRSGREAGGFNFGV